MIARCRCSSVIGVLEDGLEDLVRASSNSNVRPRMGRDACVGRDDIGVPGIRTSCFK